MSGSKSPAERKWTSAGHPEIDTRVGAPMRRCLSLPRAVAAAGGLDAWNGATAESRAMARLLDAMVEAEQSVEQTTADVRAIIALGHDLWAYAYMRTLYAKNADLYYATIVENLEPLLPVIYTPTVGEACQKFGLLPVGARGCYVSISQRGRFVELLEEYAMAEGYPTGGDVLYAVDAIVLSDGGRILGLGDLGAWGMGIPVGKLDLYTACAGVDPRRTIPILLDSGIDDWTANTAHLDLRGHPRYTGERRARERETSPNGTLVNAAYYGADNVIDELMDAAVQVFGRHVLLQFEDFNSNDAFLLLQRQRGKYLTFNDDIQGTAAVTVAGLLGALKLQQPKASELLPLLRHHHFLFHGAGAANLGAAELLVAAGVPKGQIYLTNSRGLVWKPKDGSEGGTARNAEQRAFAVEGEPHWPHSSLRDIITHVEPAFLVGATGKGPGCFDKGVIQAMCQAQEHTLCDRPTVFALSNPISQAEVSAHDAYTWSKGRVIFGSGSQFDPVALDGGRVHHPAQVNNVYCFAGVAFGAICCKASTLPDSIFLAAAEAIALSLNGQEIAEQRIAPHPARIREVSLDVATAVALGCDKSGVATKELGATPEEVRAALAAKMWRPTHVARAASSG